MRWHQEAAVEAFAANAVKSAGNDPLGNMPDVNTYGVLAHQGTAPQNAALSPQDAGERPSVVAPVASGSAMAVDHVFAANAGAPNHFLHRRLTVEQYQIFAIEVPAHAIRPEISGTIRPVRADRKSHASSVELLLMDEDEFARFAASKPTTSTYSTSLSSPADIHWPLGANLANGQKYYLMFLNTSHQPVPAIVDADFTASFE